MPSRGHISLIISATLGATLGGILGFGIAMHVTARQSEEIVSELKHSLTAKTREVVSLSQKLEALKATRTEQDHGVPANAQARHAPDTSDVRNAVDTLNVLARLRADKILQFHLPLVGYDGKVSPNLIRLLELTNDDVNVLNRALTKAHDAIEERAKQNASLVSADAEKVVIRIPPFEGGSEIYDSLITQFQQTLGEDRVTGHLKTGHSGSIENQPPWRGVGSS